MQHAPTPRPLALALAAALSACAAPKAEAPAPRFRPYSLAPQYPSAREKARPVTPRPEDLDLAPRTQMRIDEPLIAFTVEERSARARAPRRSPMTEESRQRWTCFLAAVDNFLGQPITETVPLDVVRARVALDAELDLDREHYDSVSPALVAAIRARAMGLDLRLSQVRKLTRPAKPKPGRLQWPLDTVIVTSLFGTRSDPFEGTDRFHRGIDLKARTGQLVQAAASGVVTRAGRNGGHGLQVELLHDDGATTGYSHLSQILVEVGLRVPAGGPLGLAGNTGRSTGPHLHFEVWREGDPVDPLAELPDPAFREIGGANIGDGG